jgi:hypothetical protein
MKKFIQFSLIVVLVCVLFQAAVVGPASSAGMVGSSPAHHVSSAVDTSVESFQMAACLVSVKGVICVIPNVGWNS